VRKYRNLLNWTIYDFQRLVRSVRGLPVYLSDRKKYLAVNDQKEWPTTYFPILSDRGSQSGSLGEYFWQDMFVAKQIIKKNPKRHIDVGSRIDGFIGILACVRKVELIDIRPMRVPIENVSTIQWDITKPQNPIGDVADCVSCLHTLEHIGLGRYGDEVDPDGWMKGLNSLATLLSASGSLWLSVPLGQQRVEFNAHRIFNPTTIVNEAKRCRLELKSFFFLEKNAIVTSHSIDHDFELIVDRDYTLGIFLFSKSE